MASSGLRFQSRTFQRTCMVAVMMWAPPSAPVTKYRVPFARCSTIIGDMEDRGLFPARMKLAGEGARSKPLGVLGMEKSSI